ncbi:tetratricopeptide repeat protein [Actinomyces slackii]|uniref:Flp pilus assembly protein TadD, contains TPR repeats n=1 Tax=Actinomyces slackii TaxID=52774 RepID=A0A3S4WG81_9ACTO|nr:tetratricopeptide repeat protein [Actinomyces slackii]VEG74188.1 Flp pilus assembly protein TadD, contains TPR repeats [Actinomyces slackii]
MSESSYQRYDEILTRTAQLINMGRNSQAMSALRRLEADFPEYEGDTKTLLSAVHRESGNLPQAIETAQRAVSLLPDSPAPLRALARAHIANGDAQAAEAPLRRALSLDPDDVAARHHLSIALHIRGQGDEARRIAWEGVLLAPEDSDSHLIFGMATLPEDPRLAWQAFRESAHLDPTNEQTLLQLGYASMLCGYREEMAQAIATAAALAPQEPRIPKLVGVIIGRAICMALLWMLLGLLALAGILVAIEVGGPPVATEVEGPPLWIAIGPMVATVIVCIWTFVVRARPIHRRMPSGFFPLARRAMAPRRLSLISLGILAGMGLLLVVAAVCTLFDWSGPAVLAYRAGIPACIVALVLAIVDFRRSAAQ